MIQLLVVKDMPGDLENGRYMRLTTKSEEDAGMIAEVKFCLRPTNNIGDPFQMSFSPSGWAAFKNFVDSRFAIATD